MGLNGDQSFFITSGIFLELDKSQCIYENYFLILLKIRSWIGLKQTFPGSHRMLQMLRPSHI